MLKLIITFLLLFNGLCALAGPLHASNLTVKSAVSLALQNNLDLAAARFAVAQAEGRLRQAGLWPNPELELAHNSDFAFKNEGEYTLNASWKQKFPVTGRLGKARTVARVDVALALAEIRNRERLLAGEVSALCRRWLVQREKLNASREIQGALGKLVEVSEKRLKSAEVSAVDVNTAKLELQKEQLAEQGLLNEQEIAATSLNGLLGRDPKSAVEITGTLSTTFDFKSIESINRQAMERRPDRQLAALTVDRAAAEFRLAHAERWEDWTVGFGVERDKQVFDAPIGIKTDQFLALSVSVPLALFNRNQGRIREVEASHDKARAELKALELQIGIQIQTATDQLRRLSGILRQYQEGSLKLAQQNSELLERGYEQGLTGMASVIQGKQQFIQLRQSYLETLSDFQKASTDWETATASILFSETQH